MYYSFAHRRKKKGDFRKLWITRINAAARMNGLTYNTMIHGLKNAGVEVNRKVLADFSTPDGRLKSIPARRKKLRIVLRHIVKDFKPGTRYPEAQVNQILAAYHEDTATLRRELVGFGLLQRERGEYWIVEEEGSMV